MFDISAHKTKRSVPGIATESAAKLNRVQSGEKDAGSSGAYHASKLLRVEKACTQPHSAGATPILGWPLAFDEVRYIRRKVDPRLALCPAHELGCDFADRIHFSVKSTRK
jgi:hypothetical protein